MTRYPRVILPMVVALAVSIAAACSTGDSGGGGSKADTAGAKAQLAKYADVPVWKSPGPQLDAKKILNGKTVFSMAVSSDIPYNVAMEQQIKAATEAAGGTYIGWPTNGSQDEWNQGINNAISRHADVLIMSSGLDVRTVKPALERARQAGIKVIASTWGGTTQGCVDYVDACIPMQYEEAAKTMVAHSIATKGDDANVLVVTSTDVYSSRSMIPAMEDSFKQLCGSCKTTFKDVTTANWNTQMQNEIQSALVANPSINYIIGIYDSMMIYAVPAILAAGRVGQVGLAGFNGTPGPMKFVAEDKASVDVGQDIVWAAYGTIDVALRLLSGTSYADTQGMADENIPLRVFDKSTIDEAGDPPTLTGGYGSVAIDGYGKTWGLS